MKSDMKQTDKLLKAYFQEEQQTAPKGFSLTLMQKIEEVEAYQYSRLIFSKKILGASVLVALVSAILGIIFDKESISSVAMSSDTLSYLYLGTPVFIATVIAFWVLLFFDKVRAKIFKN